MRVCTIQPSYSTKFQDSDRIFQEILHDLDTCDGSMDLIVLPEYSNVPAGARTREEMIASFQKYGEALEQKAAETARRCDAIVALGGLRKTEKGLRNSITLIGRDGSVKGCFDKQHLVPFEKNIYGLDDSYTKEPSVPEIIKADGIRFGALICYDTYFYEMYSALARENPDVILLSSYQRSDPHHVLELMTVFLAYNTNAYVVRASVSMGPESPTGACSMVVSPEGKVLMNMKNETGLGVAEFDPHAHFMKPGGYGRPLMKHHQYIEEGREPWKYRTAGPAVVLPNRMMPYPRICAHRGFNSVCPENSMPAFGAAVASGAQEIEFDLWATKDGQIVSIHDPTLDRVSDGTGKVWEHSYDELLKYDFGIKKSEAFRGLRILLFEDILKRFSKQCVMNVHVKAPDNENPLPESTVTSIVALIRKYDVTDYCYIMSGNEAVLKQFLRLAPEIPRCAGAGSDPYADLVDKALRNGCYKIQLFKPHFKFNPPEYIEQAVRKAHENGIRVNIFYSDDPEETKRYLDMGIDTILTNDYQRNKLA